MSIDQFINSYKGDIICVGADFCIGIATQADAPVVLEIIHDAFSKWQEYGIEFTPSRQGLEDTIRHISGDRGLLIYNSEDQPIATYSFDQVQLKKTSETQFCANLQSGVDSFYTNANWSDEFLNEQALVFHKFAVLQSYQKTGAGRKIIEDFFVRARKANYKVVYVETSPQGKWLYDWYIKLGFKPIGEFPIPDNRNIDSHFLRKELE